MRRFRAEAEEPIPLPGHGQTAMRFQRLAELARKDLPLARLLEAHWDAVAILREAGKTPYAGALYAVWASEIPNAPLAVLADKDSFRLSGQRHFCTGAGLVDRALTTAGLPRHQLVDLDLGSNASAIEFDFSSWKTEAFAGTNTATARFDKCVVQADDLICGDSWYLDRPGFWNGAIAPAACWAGGALGLVDYAMKQARSDPHTLAHLGSMHSAAWAMRAYLKTAGEEVDREGDDSAKGRLRALTVRHLIERACSEILERLGRAYGPYPLAMDELVLRRCQELTLYIRQCHAERDLSTLGAELKASMAGLTQ